jgi:hypothetical protein
MSTVQEILTDIDVRIPNSFTNAQKIGWINEILLQIYKYMNSDEKEMCTFLTVLDQLTYLLPLNLTLDEIITVSISNETTISSDTVFTVYEFKGPNEELNGNNYFDALNGLIGIYPIPDTTGYTVNILYEKKPDLLSATALTAIPGIDEKYHNILTFYCCNVIAKSGNNPKVTLSNNYAVDFNNAWEIFYKDYMKTKIKNPLKAKENKWWR